MKPTQVATLLLLLTATQAGARAVDWSYCLAPSEIDKRIYLSRPFPSGTARAEAVFDHMLAQRQLRHDSVQCPRAEDEASAIVMHQHAFEVNRSWGRQVIDMPPAALP